MRFPSQADLVQKALDTDIGQQIAASLRPHIFRWSIFESAGVAHPVEAVSRTAMFQLYDASDVLRPIINTLKNEIFRTGLTPEPKFVAKCVSCGTEYQSRPEEGEEGEEAVCERCGGALREPNWVEEQEIREWLRDVNRNHQSLREVCKECEKDTDVTDDAWIVAVKEHLQDKTGQVAGSRSMEFVHGDPRNMRMVGTEQGIKRGILGGKYWICLEHRQNAQNEAGTCPECGKKLHDVHFVSFKEERDSQIVNYYVDGEVLHWSKYDPSLTYGTPPALTLWQAGQTMRAMGEYVNLMFQGQHAPRRCVYLTTRNKADVEEWWKKQLLLLEQNKNYIPIIPVDPETKEGMVGVIDMMDSLQDLQFLDHKKDLRERISSFYGVSNIFQSDVSVAGGLSNESRQIMVTDRAVEFGRGIFLAKVFPWICQQMGWKDFYIDFNRLDERDEVTQLNLQAKRISNMNAMVAAGFTAEMQADGSFRYSGVGERVRSKEPGMPETPHMEPSVPPETDREESELKTCRNCGKALAPEDIGSRLAIRDDGRIVPGAVWCVECTKLLEVKAR